MTKLARSDTLALLGLDATAVAREAKKQLADVFRARPDACANFPFRACLIIPCRMSACMPSGQVLTSCVECD